MILHFEPFSGVSGDMFVGALVDLGADFKIIKENIAKLSLPDVEVMCVKVNKGGIRSTKFSVNYISTGKAVDASDADRGRSLADIEKIISVSALDKYIIYDSLAIFNNLANAEAKVHGVSAKDVHFHEVGATDAIVDIVAGVSAIHVLGADLLISSAPINTGNGVVRCLHGVLPVPAPATAELLMQAKARSYSGSVPFDDAIGELATPTGVALLTYYVKSYCNLPAGTIRGIGYGAGSKNMAMPNVLRAILHEEDHAR